MDKTFQVAGREYRIGEVKRDRGPLNEQLESLAEEYEGFDWLSVHGGIIRFYYLRKRSVA